MAEQHQKHSRLPRPRSGSWGRSELALLGAPCSVIRGLAEKLAAYWKGRHRIGFVDALHGEPAPEPAFCCSYTDGQSRHLTESATAPGLFRRRQLFADCDLVLLNGNHFTAGRQVLLLHPQKDLSGKTSRLTDVALVLLCPGLTAVPVYLQSAIGVAPVLPLDNDELLFSALATILESEIPPVNGLVLAGGRSQRMGQDKRLLDYHGRPQEEHVFDLLSAHCTDTFISCNAGQRADIKLPVIEDRFLGLGPMGGILSAFQSAPDRAWLTVACDLPFLSAATLAELVAQRDPGRLATAFLDAGGAFPEPLVTIWEPRAYPVLLQALGEGYSCPRKVLINSDVALLTLADASALRNINEPQERVAALSELAGEPAPQNRSDHA